MILLQHALLISPRCPEDFVMKFIKSSPIKSGPLDSWPGFLLMECIDILIAPVTRSANFSLMEGLFCRNSNKPSSPLCLKNPHSVKNSYPSTDLSLICCTSLKVLERVVSSRFSLYLSTNNVLNPWQSVYKAARPTEYAFLKVKNDIHCQFLC